MFDEPESWVALALNPSTHGREIFKKSPFLRGIEGDRQLESIGGDLENIRLTRWLGVDEVD